MNLTVDAIAKIINGKVNGKGLTLITNAAGLSEASSSDISFIKDSKDTRLLKLFSESKAGAVIVKTGFKANGKTTIEVENPLLAFANVLNTLAGEKRKKPKGIHPLAYVSPSAKLGSNVTVGPFCIVEDEAELADDVWLVGQNYVGSKSKIGKGTTLYPQAVLREEVSVGERCILHPGCVVGADGYGFFFADGKHNKIPQVGTVIIEDDVEIGACTTIDRATTGATIIKRGTKIDNLVQVAHNVEVGEHSLLAAQVGIAGSTIIGKGVVFGGQSGVADHMKIADRTQVGGQAGITKDTEPGSVLWGTPAIPLQEELKTILMLRRLPELIKEVKKLKEKK